ncbi:MAG: hypothetical protein ROO76_15945 [Terriglobia bacterium]|jgi:hypothetical protein|nr:hypothetical protein [Terriglobia bacterium]
MAGAPQPTWLGRLFVKTFRTLFVTLIFTMLGMGVGLMTGILWYAIGGAVRGVHPNMALAYRNIAIYVAIGFGVCALLYQLFLERRTAPRPR